MIKVFKCFSLTPHLLPSLLPETFVSVFLQFFHKEFLLDKRPLQQSLDLPLFDLPNEQAHQDDPGMCPIHHISEQDHEHDPIEEECEHFFQHLHIQIHEERRMQYMLLGLLNEHPKYDGHATPLLFFHYNQLFFELHAYCCVDVVIAKFPAYATEYVHHIID